MVNVILGFLVGAVLGSLIDCIASRALTGKSFWGRSYCIDCKKTIKAYDLFPLVSYLLLKGRCRNCHKKIPKEVLFIEVFSGIFTALIFSKSIALDSFSIFSLLELILKLYVFVILFILVLTDLKKGIIPNRITYSAIISIVVYMLFLDGLKIGVLYNSLHSTEFGRLLLPPHSDFFLRHIQIIIEPFVNSLFAGGLIGLFFGGLIYFTKGRGMGGGDLMLGIFIGLALGFPNAFLALLLSFILGSVVGVTLIITRKKHFGQTIPFGPFLSLGSMVTLLWGTEIIDWYFKLKIF